MTTDTADKEQRDRLAGLYETDHHQRSIARQDIDRPLLIVAGAGSGKTNTLCTRAIEMIKQGVAAETIMVITFTNKAAGELSERIGKLMEANGMKGASPPHSSTFHSWCYKLIREYYVKLGLSEAPDIVTEDGDLKLALHLGLSCSTTATCWFSAKPCSLSRLQTAVMAQPILCCTTSCAAISTGSEGSVTSLPDHLLVRCILRPFWLRTVRCLLCISFGICSIQQDARIPGYELRHPEAVHDRGVQCEPDHPADHTRKCRWIWSCSCRRTLAASQQSATSDRASMASVVPHAKATLAGSWKTLLMPIWPTPTMCPEASLEAWSRYRLACQPKDIALKRHRPSACLEIELLDLGIPYVIRGGASFIGGASVQNLLAPLRLMVDRTDDAAMRTCLKRICAMEPDASGDSSVYGKAERVLDTKQFMDTIGQWDQGIGEMTLQELVSTVCCEYALSITSARRSRSDGSGSEQNFGQKSITTMLRNTVAIFFSGRVQGAAAVKLRFKDSDMCSHAMLRAFLAYDTSWAGVDAVVISTWEHGTFPMKYRDRPESNIAYRGLYISVIETNPFYGMARSSGVRAVPSRYLPVAMWPLK
ncbi:hypothetical protein DL89DRAFT_270398 [Linderina pennispora]|uniref:UvrD-like helicase ATP-binding domain-containing protein n=1 Tax=Linderina pennispora TaxID=61395 RepID=A0A1Y1VYT0_9FUNG|nr:uncharacterized protein DL89DRAFT_270398 [Linderina pennispora]ORX66004.1 hypothetical protein DL89DRAFT_270398 [Linderina pennispora]